jgi:hypothetical protein
MTTRRSFLSTLGKALGAGGLLLPWSGSLAAPRAPRLVGLHGSTQPGRRGSPLAASDWCRTSSSGKVPERRVRPRSGAAVPGFLMWEPVQ